MQLPGLSHCLLISYFIPLLYRATLDSATSDQPRESHPPISRTLGLRRGGRSLPTSVSFSSGTVAQFIIGRVSASPPLSCIVRFPRLGIRDKNYEILLLVESSLIARLARRDERADKIRLGRIIKSSQPPCCFISSGAGLWNNYGILPDISGYPLQASCGGVQSIISSFFTCAMLAASR